ncbi:unnamed protein product [Linum tenue]|uniref:BTB domain-containing protein n=1 Tax=Linum tenue TaxID=586396 RepID=A0AAV0MAU7_9ROSI|nr:unnamed protein product [Linum tenue]
MRRGFYSRKARLESSTCLKDDCLIIRANVGVVTTRLEVEVAKQDSIAVPSSNLGQGLKALLESQLGFDLVFRVGHKTFRAHKSILAARSSFFRAQFFGPVGDPDLNEIIVDDIHPSIFKAMLQFIYTDELPDVHEIMGSPSTYSSMSTEATNVMQHLLVAADWYDLDRLKAFCESKLCEELTAASVATTLALADQHHCSQLKAICLRFAAHPANVAEMTQSEGFKQLKESCLRQLIKTLASGYPGRE